MTQETVSEWQGRRSTAETELPELLSDPHVRYMLQYLQQRGRPAGLSEIATHVTAEITDSPPTAVPEHVTDHVRTLLHHGHLPELDTHGVVEYDSERNVVTLTH